MKFSVFKNMPVKQFYEIVVSEKAGLAVLGDIRENEQSVQAFTQLPPADPVDEPSGPGLAAHEIFFFFTAEVMTEKKVFTR